MNEQVKQIAARIRELREILDIPQERVAEKVEVSLAEYQKYENAEDDIPIGVLYGVAAELGVDPTELLTGEAPHMDEYTTVSYTHLDVYKRQIIYRSPLVSQFFKEKKGGKIREKKRG